MIATLLLLAGFVNAALSGGYTFRKDYGWAVFCGLNAIGCFLMAAAS